MKKLRSQSNRTQAYWTWYWIHMTLFLKAMKKLLVLTIIFTPLFGTEKDCKIINQVRNQFIELAEKKHEIKCIGTQASFPKKLESIGALFQVKKLISVNESRLLILELIKEFQDIINKDKNLKPLLETVPFPADRISISLFLSEKQEFPPPDIFSHIFTSRGNIIYSTHDTNKSILDQTQIIESLEEACKKAEISIPLIRSSYSDDRKKILKQTN